MNVNNKWICRENDVHEQLAPSFQSLFSLFTKLTEDVFGSYLRFYLGPEMDFLSNMNIPKIYLMKMSKKMNEKTIERFDDHT